jgi:hypothetical protein
MKNTKLRYTCVECNKKREENKLQLVNLTQSKGFYLCKWGECRDKVILLLRSQILD